MPGWTYGASPSVAETMKDRSGSPVLRSGVGTQMLTASAFRQAAKSVVAESLPAFTRRATCRRGNVQDVALAAVDGLHLLGIGSMPITLKPASAKTTASGRPT